MGSEVRIGDLVEHAIGGGWGSDDPTPDSVEVGVIRGADFPSFNLDPASVPRRFEKSSKVPQRALRHGDIVLEISGGTKDRSTGRTVFVSQTALDRIGLSVIPASFCRLLRVDREKADSRYVYYWLQEMHAFGRAWLYQNQSTGLSNFQFKYFLETELVRLPPIEEQRAIAEVLGSLDDRIAWCATAKSRLHALGAAHLAAALDAEGLSVSRPLPSDRAQSLGEWVSVLESGSRPRGGVNGISQGVPSVGAESITRVGEFNYAKTKYVPREFFDRMRRGHVEDMDVLVYKDGGRPGVFIPHVSLSGSGHPFTEFAVNDHVYRVRVTPPYGQSFLYFWLSADQSTEEMAKRGTGAAQPGLSQSNFKQVPLPTLPASLLADLDVQLAAVIRSILHLANEQRVLADTRDALLPRLLSGELRIGDPARVLGAVA